MPKKIDLTGERFGRLLVLRKGENVNRRSGWLCRCDCGTTKTIAAADLRHNNVQSCGCLRKENSSALGKALKTANPLRNDPLYHRWGCMVQRCENPNNPSYHNYGGRGIKVCDEWRASFSAFMADMGHPPSPKHTLDRIDNDGDYAPDNCRWALRAEQLRNNRRNITFTLDGCTMTAKDWALNTGVNYQRLMRAYRNGGETAALAILKAA